MDEFLLPELGLKIDSFNKSDNTVVLIKKTSDYIEEFYSYSKMFYSSAHWLAEHLLYETNRIDELDTYIFPLVFLYRHNLELILKSIGLGICKDKVKYLKETYHNLYSLLEVIGEYDLKWAQSEEYSWLKEFLGSFTAIDKESDSFRYPFHIFEKHDLFEGKSYEIALIFEEQTHIDLYKLANKFEAAYEIINAYKTNTLMPEKIYRDFKPKFIEEGGDYYSQSVVGYKYSRNLFYPYAKSYSQVANKIKGMINGKLKSGSAVEKNTFFLPMCYLYRNAIELSLKMIIFEESGERFQARCNMLKRKKHSIKALWGMVKPYAQKYANDENNSFFHTIDNYVEQIQGLDSDSSKFRYPINKNLELYFRRNKRFDINIVGDFLEALYDAFDCIDAELNHINEIKAEIEYENISMYEPY